jgi:uncharacterized alpha-E superfamily protein
MFWIGRYVERAEATARIVDVQYHSELEGAFPLATGGDADPNALWGPILAIFGDVDRFAKTGGSQQIPRDVLDFFTFQRSNANSILTCVMRARDNARGVRELISSEMYESLNVFFLEISKWDADKILDAGPHSFFTQVKNSAHLFQGITARTMPTDEPRAFLETGMYLERAEKTSRMLDVKYAMLEATQHAQSGPLDQHQWTAVLKSVGAFEAFRKAHRFGITPAQVVSFLVLNPLFPSSICHSIGQCERMLRRISGSIDEPPVNRAERLVGRLHADLSFLTTEEILQQDLHEFLDQVQIRCNEIGNAIREAYLKY